MPSKSMHFQWETRKHYIVEETLSLKALGEVRSREGKNSNYLKNIHIEKCPEAEIVPKKRYSYLKMSCWKWATRKFFPRVGQVQGTWLLLGMESELDIIHMMLFLQAYRK